jgi:prevent-host-death family protein
MKSVSLADAKARLSALVEEAHAGEEVCITRHGKPMARLVPVEKPKKPIDFEALKAFADSMPYQTEGAGDFIRRMRDEDRY